MAQQKKTSSKCYYQTKIAYRSVEWFEEHAKGIGGSDASGIVGFNPYKSKYGVYIDKTTPKAPESGEILSEALQQGLDFEDYIKHRFMKETGKKIRECRYLLKNKEREWQLADVDGFIVGENAAVEFKTTRNFDRYNFSNGEIPAMWKAQCLHYMSTLDVERVYLCVLEFGVGFYTYEIKKEDNIEEINALLELESDFWNNNVLKRVPPLPSGNEVDTRTINEIYKNENIELPSVDLSNEAERLDRLADIKEQIKTLEQEEKEIENILKTDLGDAGVGTYNNYTVSWKERKSNRLDTTTLKAEMPNIYNKYLKESSSRTFLFKVKEIK